MILSIVLTKAKENPLTELLSPKGGLFAPCGMPKPLPLGEVALRSNDGEGKPGRKEPLRSDGQALCQSDTIAVSELFGSILALSVGLAPASSPKGGAIGRPGNFRLDAESPTGRKRAGLAYGDSGFWTSVPCQAAAGLDSGALPFPGHCASLV